jgi:hypothetical protein
VYIFCIVTVEQVHVLYCDSGIVHVLCSNIGACTRFVLRQWYVYMFCIVTVVRVHILYCDGVTVHVLCCDISTVHDLYCDIGMCTCFVF